MEFRLNLLKEVFKKYRAEVLLLAAATLIAIVSFGLFVSSDLKQGEIVEVKAEVKKPKPKKIYIDVSGAVAEPGLYELKTGSRLKNAIDEAGGLSEDADPLFFARNFNLARILLDQQKIYIPSSYETTSGIFFENNMIAGFSNNQSVVQGVAGTNEELININTADSEELETLPGIGPVTAGKIIDGRPYGSIDDLLERKIVGEKVFEQIREQIIVN